jgi:hypothetical protein
MALGEKGHSGKALFPECNTRGRGALAGKNLYLTAGMDGATLKTLFPECHPLALGEESLFPECLILALGEVSLFPECLPLALGEEALPRVLWKGTRGIIFYFFSFFASIFL